MSGIRAAILQLKLMDGVSGPARAIQAVLGKLNGAVDSFNRRRAAANAAFQGQVFQAAALGAVMLQPIRAAARLEDAMADVAKVTDLSDNALGGLRSRLIQISRETPLSADELANLTAELAAAGVASADLEKMTLLAAKSATAWGISGPDAAENLAKIKTALGLSTAESARFADQVNALSDATASTAPDLLDFSRRVGSLGKQYGFSTEEVLAFGAAMISSGATSETAATGFQAVGRALVRGQAATKGQQEALNRLGLTAKGVAKGMATDALGTVQDVFQRIRELPQEEKSSIANMLFGDEGRTALALIENTATLATSLKVLADEGHVAGSVLREFEKRISTTSGKARQLRNRVMAAGIAFGNALLPSVQDGTDALGGYADRVSGLVERNPELVKRLTLTTAGMVALRLAATGAKAAVFAMLRPTNLLIGALGYLAYANFDALAGSMRELKALATDLASTRFVKEFLSGASESLRTMGDGAQRLIGALREMAGEGTALRAWLDSVDGAGWGKTLGSVAVGLGAVGATAGALAAVAGPLRAIGKAALVLTGIKPAWALVRMLRGLGRSSAGIASAAAGLERVNQAATRAGGIRRPSLWAGLFGALAAVDAVSQIPDDEAGLKAFTEANRKRSEGWNQWLEQHVGTPRSWLGLDKPKEQNPAQGLSDGIAAETRNWHIAAQQGIRDYIHALTTGGEDAEAKAAAIASEIERVMSFEADPQVSTASLERALGLARQLAATLRGSASVPAMSGDTPRFGGPRAKGGPVAAGRAYLTGEVGPELFVPKRSGTIVPNHALGGGGVAVTINQTLQVSGHGAADLQKLAEDAARRVSTAVTGALDRQLGRSAQVAFGNLKFGDA